MLRMIGYGALGLALCACEVVETTSSVEQPGINLQGINMQGINLQGINLQGMNMLGYRFAGATLDGVPLDHVRVQRGELVAMRAGTTLRGTALAGAQLVAEVRDITVTPPATALVTYQISSIIPEDSRNDPTHTGHTFLYSLDQQVDGGWQPACPADADGRSVAIPLAAIWNEHGDRVESDTLFTFGCTTGVIAKCYRWGYRPWVNGFGDLVPMHQTCTRVARADYCGNGIPNTRDGTEINVWDRLSPRPIQTRATSILGLPPVGMIFEAGWNTNGAVCLSHSRWVLPHTLLLVAACPDRLIPPGLFGTVCNTLPEVLGFDADARLFNDASLTNLINE